MTSKQPIYRLPNDSQEVVPHSASTFHAAQSKEVYSPVARTKYEMWNARHGQLSNGEIQEREAEARQQRRKEKAQQEQQTRAAELAKWSRTAKIQHKQDHPFHRIDTETQPVAVPGRQVFSSAGAADYARELL
ncbi:uncharacterized protein JCM6883_000602 [Sporobolomyces salmoneus]|uniref:uncharacterized protein n=1 Tax=Sporobolomyces salmoneus TaxID=183962 RepID=UPI00317E277D